jgi:hypothetical protein
MDSQSFLAALAPALTDSDARTAFLAEPRVALAAAGLDLPDWVTVTAREGDAPEIAVVLPPLLDPDAELSEEHLAAVSGGCDRGGPPPPNPSPNCGTGCQMSGQDPRH